MARKKENDKYSNSVINPRYESASYFFDNRNDVVQSMHKNEKSAGRYGRYDNPTWLAVEEELSDIIGYPQSLLFSSGMAAHAATFFTFLKPGDEVLMPSEIYRMTRILLAEYLGSRGITVHEAPLREPSAFIDAARKLGPRLRLVHLEMPSSPHMYLVDIEKVRKALPKKVILTLDASFAPPPNLLPAKYGIDVAIYSGTKYLSGHGDIVIGAVSGKRKFIESIRQFRAMTGSIPSGHTADLLRRSLYTLKLRVEKANEQGLELARFLDKHPKVTRVYFNGLPSHAHFELAKKYFQGNGSVVTFELGVSEGETAKFVDKLKIPYMASNFGTPHTLIEQSTFFTYFEYSDEELINIGVDKSTVRLSVGFTDEVGEVIKDLEQALKGLKAK